MAVKIAVQCAPADCSYNPKLIAFRECLGDLREIVKNEVRTFQERTSPKTGVSARHSAIRVIDACR
jgi:hypothetical protein